MIFLRKGLLKRNIPIIGGNIPVGQEHRDVHGTDCEYDMEPRILGHQGQLALRGGNIT